MTTAIPFTDNYRDLSNEDGYQFEFHCERCGNGYRSGFQRNVVSTGQSILRGVGNLFGGTLRDIANASDSALNRGTNSVAKDRALQKAVDELSDRFTQCRGCGDWVCEAVCWNAEIGQCTMCSPRSAEELARLRAEARTIQLREKLTTTDLVGGVDVVAPLTVTCPSCGAPSTGGKFCNECGSPLSLVRTCASCGHENAAHAKFCAECGVRATA